MLPDEVVDQVNASVTLVEVWDEEEDDARGASGFFVDERHLLTYHDFLDGLGESHLKILGNSGPDRSAVVLAAHPWSNLVLARLSDGEPPARTWLDLSKEWPTENTKVHLFAYGLSQKKGWGYRSWPGVLSPELEVCDCSNPDCPYSGEKNGWPEALMKMGKCRGWGGGPIVDSDGHVLSMGVAITQVVRIRCRPRGPLRSRKVITKRRALLLGANLQSMREILALRTDQS